MRTANCSRHCSQNMCTKQATAARTTVVAKRTSEALLAAVGAGVAATGAPVVGADGAPVVGAFVALLAGVGAIVALAVGAADGAVDGAAVGCAVVGGAVTPLSYTTPSTVEETNVRAMSSGALTTKCPPPAAEVPCSPLSPESAVMASRTCVPSAVSSTGVVANASVSKTKVIDSTRVESLNAITVVKFAQNCLQPLLPLQSSSTSIDVTSGTQVAAAKAAEAVVTLFRK